MAIWTLAYHNSDSRNRNTAGEVWMGSSGGGPVKISILVPIYNELRHIRELLDRIVSAPLPANCSKEIIVIDDGSTDGTTALLDAYAAGGKITLHKSILNFGKGVALRIGFTYATGDILLVQDGDLEYDPRQYPQLIEPILQGAADVVYGSRFLGTVERMDFLHRVANKILTGTANLLYRTTLSDEATAYKAFRKSVLEKIQLNCRRFDFCPEFTAKVSKLGIPIHEVPISYRSRSIAEGKKIRWVDGVQAIWVLIKHRFI